MMDEMCPRERVFRILRHQFTDRMPVTLDIGASAGIDKTYIDIFRTHSGAEDPAEYFNYDIRSVSAPLTATTDDFTSYYDTIPPGTTFDEFGVGHVPAGEFPLGLDIHPWYKFSDPEQIEDYPFPVFEMDERVVWEIGALRSRGFVVSAAAGSINEWCYYLRGMDRFLMDMVLHKEMARETLERVTALCIIMGKALAEAGVDILCYYGDMGSQNSLLMSPGMWAQWIKPCWRKIVREVRKVSKATFIFYHSCGYIEPIIPGLIEAGFDILNPIQPESMDPVKIKKMYGDKIALWGGIGMQSTMLKGSAEDVRKAVRDLIEVWAQRGGGIVTAAQTMLPDVAWENVQTLVDTVEDYSREVFTRLNPGG